MLLLVTIVPVVIVTAVATTDIVVSYHCFCVTVTTVAVVIVTTVSVVIVTIVAVVIVTIVAVVSFYYCC